MGTKNNPGKFDCYAHAEPDEPMFILLGRDPVAGVVVSLWAALRIALGETSPEKIAEAKACAIAMTMFAIERGKVAAVDKANRAFKRWMGLPKIPNGLG